MRGLFVYTLTFIFTFLLLHTLGALAAAKQVFLPTLIIRPCPQSFVHGFNYSSSALIIRPRSPLFAPVRTLNNSSLTPIILPPYQSFVPVLNQLFIPPLIHSSLPLIIPFCP